MKKQKRMSSDGRKEQIVLVALALSQGQSYMKVTREEIANEIGISGPAVQHHFGTMKQLQRSIMRAACQRAPSGDVKSLRVVAQGLHSGNDMAKRVSEEVKRMVAGLSL